MEVLKLDDLPFPVLLGCDAPGFHHLVRTALTLTTAILEKEEQSGRSSLSERAKTLLFANWDTEKEFLRAEETDPTLASIRFHVAKEESEVVDYRRANCIPHFEKVRGTLWRIAGPEQAGGANR